jgi:hypothetical protein
MNRPHDEVLDLNVGGQFFSVKRSILCSVEGSALEAMFSGRHEYLMRDGKIYVDRNP